ncbi:hypothetical protein [Methylocapsa palsarum]|nr:hypothetical protein [Methylocapsa palsarum]
MDKTAAENKPDAWERFERAIDAAVKSGPKPKAKPKIKKGLATKPSPKS